MLFLDVFDHAYSQKQLLGGGNALCRINVACAKTEIVPSRTPYLHEQSGENMAAALARRVSGVYLQFDIHTLSFHSPNFVIV